MGHSLNLKVTAATEYMLFYYTVKSGKCKSKENVYTALDFDRQRPASLTCDPNTSYRASLDPLKIY